MGFLMANSTSITYHLKRKILTFTNKISRRLSKPDRKFTADMVYGILAARSCLLTDISDQLHETAQKANTVKRLSNHLSEGTPASAAASAYAFREWNGLMPQGCSGGVWLLEVAYPSCLCKRSLKCVED